MPNPVVFVHGYSDKGASWAPWREILRPRLGLNDADIRTCTYVSLNNEVTVKDLALGAELAKSTESRAASGLYCGELRRSEPKPLGTPSAR